MKLFVLLFAALAWGQDASAPFANIHPKVQDVTVEQLQTQLALQQKEITKLQRKLTVYQQSAFRCQDAMLDAQIEQQIAPAKPPRVEPPKPEAK
jgi:uncharacterized coiled-coil protein SlyX